MGPQFLWKWILKPAHWLVVYSSLPEIAAPEKQLSALRSALGNMRLQRQRKMARAPAKLESALLLTEEWNTSSNDLLNFFVLIVQKLPNIERSR